MTTRTALITGGNTGLGFEVIKALFRSERIYKVFLGARFPAKAQNAVQTIRTQFPNSKSEVIVLQVDVTDDASIINAYEKVSSLVDHIDVLINNAGGAFDQELLAGKMSLREASSKSFDLNVSSVHVMTHVFMPLLLESSDPRLIFLASGSASLTETEDLQNPLSRAPPAGWPKEPGPLTFYRSSKAAVNMIMREWERILRNEGVKVFACSPGYLATGLDGSAELNRKMGAIDPSIGADLVKDVVEGQRDADVGNVVTFHSIQSW